jgi:hypothetical protein
MPLPEISYKLDRERLERESPAYTRLILDAGRKEPKANIAYRKWVRERCRDDEDFRATILEICRREPLFFANVFCYVEEPRKGQSSVTYPFITYEFQDAFLVDVFSVLGSGHHQTLKSRETGWTWQMMGVVMPHQFCLARGPKYTVASSDKEMVESTENPDTLMAKFDFCMERLPWWMTGSYNPGLTHHKQLFHRYNPSTRCVITGASTTADIARGGRRTAIIPDEFAGWADKDSHGALAAMEFATDSIIAGSTPKGVGGAFHHRWKDVDSPALKVELCWEDHPRYRVGMYTSENGVLRILDDDFWGQDGPLISRRVKNKIVDYTRETYPFELDGKIRSPLYDLRCLSLGSPALIAQELDRDFIGSGKPFFDTNLLRKLEIEHAREPVCRVDLDVDFEMGELVDWKIDDTGLLLLWRKPETGIAWNPDSRFWIGCDVASGSGGDYASNATIEIFDADNGEQVGEMASDTIDPTDLACYAAALGYWFNRATIAFEKDGHGLAFLKQVFRKLQYPNLYYPRRAEKEAGTKLARSPGWAPRPETKLIAFKEFASAQRKGDLIIRSKRFYDEQRQFVHDGQKGVCHERAKVVEDRSEGRHKHGDRVSGGVIAFKCAEESPKRPVVEQPKVTKPGTLQWWLDRYDAEEKTGRSTWTPSGTSYASRIKGH